MQQLYRILVKPYNFDHWDIFTESEELFNEICACESTDDAREHFGSERWDEISDAIMFPPFPYVLLGEAELRQYD